MIASESIHKFICGLMLNGKVSQLEKIVFFCFRDLKYKFNMDSLSLFLYVVDEIMPYIELRTLRLGSVFYRIPKPLSESKQLNCGIKLLAKTVKITCVRNVAAAIKIQQEILAVLQKKSLLFKQNRNLYQVASNNRSFAHYRWD